jgi:hypothetical protein
MDIRAYSITPSSNTADFPENMSPAAVNDEARELQAELAQYLVDNAGSIDSTGTSTAYALTLSTAPAALANGLQFSCTIDETNAAGPVTLVVTPSGGSAFASKKIKCYLTGAEADLPAAAMIAGNHYLFQYDSAADGATGAYILLNPQPMLGQSLAADGYYKLPGGLILQWGDVVFSAAATSPVTFPLTFPTVAYNVQVTSNATSIVMSGNALTTSGFTINSSPSFSGTAYWFAVGK